MQNQSLDELDALAEELTLRREVDKDGIIRYYNSDNKLHRIHGPAVIWDDGSEDWYQNGKMHRLDGPAIIFTDGTMEWYQDGKRHCLDGPSITEPGGYKSWYIDGVHYTEDEFNAHPLVIAHKSKDVL